MDQVRLARQSNRVVRRWPRAQRAMACGEIRSAPVLYLRDRDRLVVMAANAGADRELPLIALQPAGT